MSTDETDYECSGRSTVVELDVHSMAQMVDRRLSCCWKQSHITLRTPSQTYMGEDIYGAAHT
jgi:hypothetical protein